MDAKEALKLTKGSVRKKVVDAWIKQIYRRIEKAAGRGEHFLLHLFKGFWMPRLNNREAKEICLQMESLDFTIIHYPYPGDGVGIKWSSKPETSHLTPDT